MTVSPRYDQYKDAWDTEVIIEVGIYIDTYTYIFVHNADHQGCKFSLL